MKNNAITELNSLTGYSNDRLLNKEPDELAKNLISVILNGKKIKGKLNEIKNRNIWEKFWNIFNKGELIDILDMQQEQLNQLTYFIQRIIFLQAKNRLYLHKLAQQLHYQAKRNYVLDQHDFKMIHNMVEEAAGSKFNLVYIFLFLIIIFSLCYLVFRFIL